MSDIIKSKNGVNIRITEERWFHIIENHNDLAGYYDYVPECIETPDFIIKGYNNALIALKNFSGNKFLAVVYKEINENDGFVITAYFTNKVKLEKEEILWKK
ncbi:MAG: PBECR3 domain-containing polyvalent protein [bacterium]